MEEVNKNEGLVGKYGLFYHRARNEYLCAKVEKTTNDYIWVEPLWHKKYRTLNEGWPFYEVSNGLCPFGYSCERHRSGWRFFDTVEELKEFAWIKML